MLDKAGLIIHHGVNRNYTVLNRQKSSKRKKYAVVYDWRYKELHDAIKRIMDGKSLDNKIPNKEFES